MQVADRFWSKVEQGDADDCWHWKACVVDGYGQFGVGGRKRVKAHRFAYESLVGPIPEGLVIDHLCRNRLCVNPAHLEPVTRRENTLRGVTLPAIYAVATRCINGHDFSDDNTYTRPNGKRDCRICQRERHRTWVRKQRDRRPEEAAQ